jgi:hypothetical protein
VADPEVVLRALSAFYETTVDVLTSDISDEEKLARIYMLAAICDHTLRTNGKHMMSDEPPPIEAVLGEETGNGVH